MSPPFFNYILAFALQVSKIVSVPNLSLNCIAVNFVLISYCTVKTRIVLLKVPSANSLE
jgi:hypothetical protein